MIDKANYLAKKLLTSTQIKPKSGENSLNIMASNSYDYSEFLRDNDGGNL